MSIHSRLGNRRVEIFPDNYHRCIVWFRSKCTRTCLISFHRIHLVPFMIISVFTSLWRILFLDLILPLREGVQNGHKGHWPFPLILITVNGSSADSIHDFRIHHFNLLDCVFRHTCCSGRILARRLSFRSISLLKWRIHYHLGTKYEHIMPNNWQNYTE